MRLALVTDAWAPQVNGVVRTLSTTVAHLRGEGHAVEVIAPPDFRTIPCPSYPEIRLALGAGPALARRLEAFAPDRVHVATEGPLGWAARAWCRRHRFPFTTSFHTRFPDYVAVRTGLPASLFWPVLRRFHGAAARTYAATSTLADELSERGIERTHRWSRGVDLAAFSPHASPLAELADLPRPILLNVGRVALEKNIEAFLDCDVPGSKVVVGDGPALPQLRERYRDVRFLGALRGAKLAGAFAAADTFVFPSLTDTFGLVIIEALASGVPVAAFPVPGPIDIVGPAGCGTHGSIRPIGALDTDLATAIRHALAADRQACRSEAEHYSWARATAQFVAGLEPIAAVASDRTAHRLPLRVELA